MKKVSYLILSCIICFSLCSPVFALQPDNSRITETIDEDGSIIRTMRRIPNPVAISEVKSLNCSETKADLIALGIDDEVIDKMSMAELQDFSNSVQITTIEQYMCSDTDGNIRYLTKEEALSAVADAKIVINENNKYEDQYMRVTVTIAMIPNNRVRITTDANWLTDPKFRGKDVLGACAEFVTIFDQSRYGYLAYTVEQRSRGGTLIESERTSKAPSKYADAGYGSYYGAGMIFDLPNNITYPPTGVVYEEMYTDFHAHFSYDGEIKFPDQRLNFNVTGTYTHTKVGITFNPSLTISLKEAVASITPSVDVNKESYTAQLEVSYTP